jgi:hypothetical protein
MFHILKSLAFTLLTGILGGIAGVVFGHFFPVFASGVDLFAWGAYGAVSGLALELLMEGA